MKIHTLLETSRRAPLRRRFVPRMSAVMTPCRLRVLRRRRQNFLGICKRGQTLCRYSPVSIKAATPTNWHAIRSFTIG
jgi:hypothetical protein